MPVTNDGINPNPPQVSNICVSDHHMPAATITRIVRSILPDNARIDDDAREAIQEFIMNSLLTLSWIAFAFSDNVRFRMTSLTSSPILARYGRYYA